MANNSKIEWTNTTWNPIRGCSLVSPGCKKCYAMKQAHRFSGPGGAYEGLTQLTSNGPVWTGKVKFVPEHLADPLKWREPRRVFVNSMSDLFHDGVTDAELDQIFAVMALAAAHSFQILTKRPERMLKYLSAPDLRAKIAREANALMRANKGANSNALAHVFTWGRMENAEPGEYANYLAGIADRCWPLPNVWLGVSCENQATADERIPLLLQTPAAVRWVSAEPLLGPISFRWAAWDNHQPHPRRIKQLPDVERDGRALAGSVDHLDGARMLDWVVCGGEAGPGARPMHPDWARSLRDQCKAAGTPYFHKQNGEWIDAEQIHDSEPRDVKFMRPDGSFSATPHIETATMLKVGKKAAGRLLDGKEHSEYPLQPNQCNYSGSWHAIGSQGCTMEAVSGTL